MIVLHLYINFIYNDTGIDWNFMDVMASANRYVVSYAKGVAAVSACLVSKH